VDRDGDLYGDGVNIAARVEPVSPDGGVAVSGHVRDLVVEATEDLAFEKLPARPLKNIERTIDLFRVVLPWEGEVAGPAPAAEPEAAAGHPSLADRWFEEALEAEEAPAVANRVVVLPLANASGEPGDEFIARGISAELITAVSFARGLEVIAWDSALRHAGLDQEPARVCRELKAGVLVRGRAMIAGGKAVLDLECLSADGETTHWAKRYEGDLRTMAGIYVDVAGAIGTVTGVKIQDGEVSRMVRIGTASPYAKILYLHGRNALESGTVEDIQQARDWFLQALERDGDYALAHAGLARSFLKLGMSGRFPAGQMHMLIMPGAVQAARRAVECGRFLGETHLVRGMVRLGLTWDAAGAASELRQAVDLKTGCAEAHAWRALALAAMGRFEEVDTELHRAGELDPSGPESLTISALIWYLARRYERAVTVAESALKLHPDLWPLHAVRGLARAAEGEYGEATESLRKGCELAGFQPMASAALGHVLGRAGRRDEALTILRELDGMKSHRFVPSYAPALVLAGLGDAEGACARLNEAVDEQLNWLMFLNLTPLFDSVRADPRYAALVERSGLVSLAEVAG